MNSLNKKIESIYDSIEHRFEVKNERLNFEDAQYLSQELERSPTVVSREPEWLVEHSDQKKSISIYHQNKIIGFILMDIYSQDFSGKKIHENMSLWVDKEYRGQKLGIFLILKITEEFNGNPIVSITPNKKVGYISEKYLGFKEMSIEHISKDLLKILESGGPLQGKGYQFYFNQELQELDAL